MKLEFINACEKGEIEVVNKLLDAGANPNDGIHYAAQEGHKDVINLLLERGAEVDCKENWSCTALHVASASGNLDIVKLLLDKGAQINEINHASETALIIVLEVMFPNEKHTELIKFLVDKGANVNATDRSGQSAILYAVDKEDIETVKLLCRYGARVGKIQGFSKDYTALTSACARHNPQMVKLLLEAGANPNQSAANGYRPILHETLQKLSHETSESNKKNFFEIVMVLLNYGANVKLSDKDGKSALHYASEIDYKLSIKILQELIDKGVDINAVDKV